MIYGQKFMKNTEKYYFLRKYRKIRKKMKIDGKFLKNRKNRIFIDFQYQLPLTITQLGKIL